MLVLPVRCFGSENEYSKQALSAICHQFGPCPVSVTAIRFEVFILWQSLLHQTITSVSVSVHMPLVYEWQNGFVFGLPFGMSAVARFPGPYQITGVVSKMQSVYFRGSILCPSAFARRAPDKAIVNQQSWKANPGGGWESWPPRLRGAGWIDRPFWCE